MPGFGGYGKIESPDGKPPRREPLPPPKLAKPKRPRKSKPRLTASVAKAAPVNA